LASGARVARVCYKRTAMSAPKITLEEVFKVARLARLSPNEEEARSLQHELDAILGYVAMLDAVDTRGVEPTAHAITLASPLRADVVVPSLSQEQALAAAPSSREGGFSVPKVMEVES